jgi:hypothetical protein
MYYEINVSLNGKHFFATAERSIISAERCLDVYDALSLRFHKIDGYEIVISRVERKGRYLSRDTLVKEMVR